MINGTQNQYVKFSKKFGGVRKVFEGKVEILVGGFKFDMNDLPASGNVLPAGTPVSCDEATRKIAPMYAFKVIAVEGTKVSVYKFNEGTRAKVGMTLAVNPTAFDTAATNAAKVTAIDSSNDGYDVLTVDAATGITEGTILIEATTDKKVKVKPNALLPYDVCVDEDAFAADGDGAWSCERPVLENRLAPVPQFVKDALLKAGCYFRFSNRK